MTMMWLKQQALRILLQPLLLFGHQDCPNHSTIKSLNSNYVSETVIGTGNKRSTEDTVAALMEEDEHSMNSYSKCDVGDGDGDDGNSIPHLLMALPCVRHCVGT